MSVSVECLFSSQVSDLCTGIFFGVSSPVIDPGSSEMAGQES